MAGLQIIVWNFGTQMVNMMVAYITRKPLKDFTL